MAITTTGNGLAKTDGTAMFTKPHGTLYVTSPAATTITAAGTFYLVAPTTAGGVLNEFTQNGSGRLTYTGTITRYFEISANVSMTSSVNSNVTQWKIFKNGVAHDPSLMKRKIGTGSDVGSSHLTALLTLATNDYIEVYCTGDGTNGHTITADTLHIIASAK